MACRTKGAPGVGCLGPRHSLRDGATNNRRARWSSSVTRAGLPATPPALDGLIGRPTATVPEVLRARAAATPERTFLFWEGERWTYERALKEARTFSGWVLGVSPTDPPADRRIASFLANRPEAVWTWFGSPLAGATYVPLNRAH